MVRFLIVFWLMGTLVIRAEETYPVLFYLAPCAPVVRSIKEFSFDIVQSTSGTGTMVVHSAEWELRDERRHRRVARVPAQVDFYAGVQDKRSPRPDGTRNDFSDEDDLRRIGPLQPGNYHIALLIDGKRASNVVAFQIDPNFNPANWPVLTVGMEEAPPGEKMGVLLVWIVGPSPPDQKLTNYAMVFGDITVDGRVHTPSPKMTVVWTGPIVPYSTGDTSVSYYDPGDRLKGVDVSKLHDYAVTVGSHSSAAVKLNLSSHELAKEWDAETATMAPLPESRDQAGDDQH